MLEKKKLNIKYEIEGQMSNSLLDIQKYIFHFYKQLFSSSTSKTTLLYFFF
jgi:hypothetical protein